MEILMLIEQSTFLTEGQKTYWRSKAEGMTENQQMELIDILREGEKIKKTEYEKKPEFFSILRKIITHCSSSY